MPFQIKAKKTLVHTWAEDKNNHTWKLPGSRSQPVFQSWPSREKKSPHILMLTFWNDIWKETAKQIFVGLCIAKKEALPWITIHLTRHSKGKFSQKCSVWPEKLPQWMQKFPITPSNRLFIDIHIFLMNKVAGIIISHIELLTLILNMALSRVHTLVTILTNFTLQFLFFLLIPIWDH